MNFYQLLQHFLEHKELLIELADFVREAAEIAQTGGSGPTTMSVESIASKYPGIYGACQKDEEVKQAVCNIMAGKSQDENCSAGTDCCQSETQQ